MMWFCSFWIIQEEKAKSHPQITQIRADFLRGFKRKSKERGGGWCILVVEELPAFHPSPCPLPSEGRGFQRLLLIDYY